MNFDQFLEGLFRQNIEALIRIEVLLTKILESQVRQNSISNEYLNILVSAPIHTTPNAARSLNVGITPVELIRNDSTQSLTVNVANLDPAQPLWIGLENVSTNTGRIIIARDNVLVVVPQGQRLYGVTDVGTILIVVSQLTGLFSSLIQAAGGPI